MNYPTHSSSDAEHRPQVRSERGGNRHCGAHLEITGLSVSANSVEVCGGYGAADGSFGQMLIVPMSRHSGVARSRHASDLSTRQARNGQRRSYVDDR